MRRPSLEGASCAELNPAVVDNFFEANVRDNRVMARAALNICARCPVAPECLQDALNGPYLYRGIRAGLPVTRINEARSWIRYEQNGGRMPKAARPEWLPRSDAAEMVESTWVAADGDETEGEL